MDLKNKTVAVTGGSGFLGKRIVEKLKQKGAKVIIPRQKDYDFTDLNQNRKFFNENKMDILIHSAAVYGGIAINEKMPADIFDVNTRMLLNIFKAALEFHSKIGLKKIVLVSSACAYPSSLGTDMREELLWNGPADRSVMNYGVVKRLMETIGHVYRTQYGLHSINLPLATLYGEGDTYNPLRSHAVAALIRKIVEAHKEGKDKVELWGTPDIVREFIYVKDAAEGIVLATEKFEGMKNFDEESNDQSKYTLNIGTGNNGINIGALAKLIADIVGCKAEFIYSGKSAGQKEKALDIGRMKKVLNWQPTTTLEKGLKKTISWYIKNKTEADKRF